MDREHMANRLQTIDQKWKHFHKFSHMILQQPLHTTRILLHRRLSLLSGNQSQSSSMMYLTVSCHSSHNHIPSVVPGSLCALVGQESLETAERTGSVLQNFSDVHELCKQKI